MGAIVSSFSRQFLSLFGQREMFFFCAFQPGCTDRQNDSMSGRKSMFANTRKYASLLLVLCWLQRCQSQKAARLVSPYLQESVASGIHALVITRLSY